MKKLFSLLLTAAILLTFAACGDGSCESIELNKYEITLTEAGDTFGLKVTTDPKDTTDDIEFESSNEDVATVSKRGLITAVGEGHATITVICGDETEYCEVTCDFGRSGTSNTPNTPSDTDGPSNSSTPSGSNEPEETTPPTQTPTEAPTPTQTDNVLFATIDGMEYTFELDYARVKQDIHNRQTVRYIQAHYYAYNPRGEVIYELYLNFDSNLTVGTYTVMGDNYALDLGFGIRATSDDILYDTNRSPEAVAGSFTISEMSSDWNTYTGYFIGELENEDEPGTIELVVTYFNFTLYS